METRVSWAWPSIFPEWGERFRKPDSSVPLQPPPDPPPRLFESIDWLGTFADRSQPLFTDPLVLYPENARQRSAWSIWEPLSEHESITLVRGGFPSLLARRGRLRFEYGDEFDDVKRMRGQMVWALTTHVGIDASINSWQDDRPAPKGLGDFWTGDANLVYSLGAQRVAMRGGVGAAFVYDTDYEVGYNFTYGADLFLTRPWLVSGEIDYGAIDNEKFFHWRGTFGVQLLLFELYIGYDSYKWNQIRFDGPIVGAGLWF